MTHASDCIAITGQLLRQPVVWLDTRLFVARVIEYLCCTHYRNHPLRRRHKTVGIARRALGVGNADGCRRRSPSAQLSLGRGTVAVGVRK